MKPICVVLIHPDSSRFTVTAMPGLSPESLAAIAASMIQSFKDFGMTEDQLRYHISQTSVENSNSHGKVRVH